ncbi:MAG: hypothetical protein ACOYMA_14240 [Bacteroidia bacterium]
MNYFKIITILFLILFLANCNPKEEIAPENPCGKYIKPSADFVKEYSLGYLNDKGDDYLWYNNSEFPFDSISLPNSKINFRSAFNDTSKYKHTWYIGSEKFNNYKAWRDFSEIKHNTKITIIHVLKWKPNLLCNPLETGYDSISKSFTILDSVNQMGVFGMYRMVYDTFGASQFQDSVDIEFYLSKTDPDTTRLKGASVKNQLIRYAYRIKNIKYNVLDRDTFNYRRESYKIGWGGLLSNTFWLNEVSLNKERPPITPISDIRIQLLNNNVAKIMYMNYGKWIYLKGRKIN